MKTEVKSAVYLWRPAACLRLSGPDAAMFLQGQFTNDVKLLEARPAIYGLWLNQKGHVLADSFALRAGDGAFWLVSYFSPVGALRERLEAYLIADEVIIEDQTDAWAAATFFGADESEAKKLGAVFCFAGRRAAQPAIECLFPAGEEKEMETRIGAAKRLRLSDDEIELMRLRAGLPAVPRDIGPADLPNEGGLEADAISYTKGCYLGQEVMARLRSMGRVRRRLMRVAGAGAPPRTPTALFQGGKKVGELRSAAADGEGGFIGLAMLALPGLDEQAGLSLAPAAAPTMRLQPGN